MTMYCPECGTKLDDDALFCPECGTRVRDDVAAAPAVAPAAEAAAQPAPSPAPADEKQESIDTWCGGLILTHVARLADKFGVAEADLRSLFDRFIAAKRMFGVDYQLVDAGAVNKGFFGTLFGRSRGLGSDAQWYDYADLLRRAHEARQRRRQTEASYLFIVGGDDIVPMPVIRHYLADNDDFTDKTIDTDLLYAFPYGRQMEQALLTGEIYQYDMLFHVGRLPLATDATVDDLFNYMERDLNNPVVGLSEAYAQCDPHWRLVTAANTRVIDECRLFPRYKQALPSEVFSHNIFLTPEVEVRNIERVFNRDAQLVFFNLHGGNAPQSTGFVGQSVTDERDWRAAIAPEHLTLLHEPNVIVTEACYGARFKNYDKAHSMLLTALSAQTLLYVGSSRIAFGAVDGRATSPEAVRVSLADVLTSTFVAQVLSGQTAGEAFFEARRALLRGRIGPYEATTLAEFNLFGDPTLFVGGLDDEDQKTAAAHKTTANPVVAPARKEAPQCASMGEKGAPSQFSTAPLGGGKAAGASLLQQVRSAVDANLEQIHQAIAEQLYAAWGVEPRRLMGSSRLRFADGTEAYDVRYDQRSEGDTREASTSILSVTADASGKVLAVSASK